MGECKGGIGASGGCTDGFRCKLVGGGREVSLLHGVTVLRLLFLGRGAWKGGLGLYFERVLVAWIYVCY